MTSIELEEQRSLANGGSVLAGGFTGAVRSDEVVTLEKGDKFTIPTDFKALDEPIAGSNRKAQFTIVNVQKANGTTMPAKVFPSYFSKSRMTYNAATKQQEKVMKAKGTAVDEYRKHAKVQDAMKAVAGREIIVTNVERGTVLNRVQGEYTETPFLELNFA